MMSRKYAEIIITKARPACEAILPAARGKPSELGGGEFLSGPDIPDGIFDMGNKSCAVMFVGRATHS
jgi:hypothetical protein